VPLVDLDSDDHTIVMTEVRRSLRSSVVNFFLNQPYKNRPCVSSDCAADGDDADEESDIEENNTSQDLYEKEKENMSASERYLDGSYNYDDLQQTLANLDKPIGEGDHDVTIEFGKSTRIRRPVVRLGQRRGRDFNLSDIKKPLMEIENIFPSLFIDGKGTFYDSRRKIKISQTEYIAHLLHYVDIVPAKTVIASHGGVDIPEGLINSSKDCTKFKRWRRFAEDTDFIFYLYNRTQLATASGKS
jgi:hypothetical protein